MLKKRGLFQINYNAKQLVEKNPLTKMNYLYYAIRIQVCLCPCKNEKKVILFLAQIIVIDIYTANKKRQANPNFRKASLFIQDDFTV